MISPKGLLTPQRLIRILGDLTKHRYTAHFAAEDGKTAKEFYFVGSGVKVTSVGTRKSQPVGRFWLSAGAVTEEVIREALKLQAEGADERIGDLLVDGGHITDEQRTAGLTDLLVEELCDLFFWPGPKYHYQPGHQTRVGTASQMREKAGVKSLSLKTDIDQVIGRVKVESAQLKDAGRYLGGVEPPYKISPAGKEILFTRDAFMKLPAPQRKLLPLFNSPRSGGEIIEGAGLPWSQVLHGMMALYSEKFIIPA